MSSKNNSSIERNGIYNLTGGVIRIALGIVLIPVLIRSLGIEEYGLWTLVSSILGVVNLAEAGLSTTTTIFVSQEIGKKDYNGLSETINISLVVMLFFASISGLALYFSSAFIVECYPRLSNSQSTSFLYSLQIGGLVVWCRLFQQVLVGIEQAYERYDVINIINTLYSILISIGTIIIVMSSGRTLEIMQYNFLVSLFFLIFHCYIVKRLIGNVYTKFSLMTAKALDLIKYSLMMWGANIGGVLFSRVDRIIVGSLLGPKSLGVYSVITDVGSQINVLSAMAAQPLMSSISNEINLKSKLLQKKVLKSLFINLYIAIFLGLVINAFSPLILSILLKQKIDDLDKVYLMSFKIGIAIYSLYSVNSSSYFVLLGTKKVGICSIISLLVGVISLSLVYFGSVTLGLVGAILGNAGFLGVYAFMVTSMKVVGITFKKYLNNVIFMITVLVTNSALTILVSLSMQDSILISSFLLLAASFVLISNINRLDLESI